MRPRAFDPRRLDVDGFTRAKGTLHGRWPLAGFTRLLDSIDREGASDTDVEWAAAGSMPARPGERPHAQIRLTAAATVALQCQRCLKPLRVRVDVDRAFRFAADEQEAERLDAETDEDVLALTHELDLRALLEDELLLTLPLVPRHDVCATPRVPADAGAEPAVGSPFAGLEGLLGKRRGKG